MAGTPFRVMVPIIKSVADADTGEIHHHGIASDESLDIQNDRIAQQLIAKSYGYLSRWGKFNWDHHLVDIGEVMGAEYATPEQARERFGVAIEKGGTAVWGTVYPLLEGIDNPPDLVTAHRMFRSGARLGYSLDGIAVRKSNGDFDGIFVNRVAICPQPINVNATCKRVVKSLAGALEHIGISDEELPEMLQDLPEAPDLLVAYEALRQPDDGHVRISKALFGRLVHAVCGTRNHPRLGGLAEALDKSMLEAGTGVDAEKYEGGRALQKENNGQRRRRKKSALAAYSRKRREAPKHEDA